MCIRDSLENKMPMYVFGLNEENSIVNALTGKFNGTKASCSQDVYKRQQVFILDIRQADGTLKWLLKSTQSVMVSTSSTYRSL